MPGGLVPTFHFRTLIHSRISHEAPAHTEARPPATLPILYIYQRLGQPVPTALSSCS